MTTTGRASITVDQQAALGRSVDALAAEFDGAVERAEIVAALGNAYAALASEATVHNYLPLLAEKATRRALRAHSESVTAVGGSGGNPRPKVLFVCVHNAGRSQMALGFFTHHAGPDAVGWSAGTDPASEVSPVAAAVMLERGIDIRGQRPTRWSADRHSAADVVVDLTRGLGALPAIPGTRLVEWNLPDPAAWDVPSVRPIRDEIERRVLRLLEELGVASARTDPLHE